MKLTQEEIKKIHDKTGVAVLSNDGERIGFVAGVLRVDESTDSQKNPEYIILGSELFDDTSIKYFAVPAYADLFDMSEMTSSDTQLTARITKEMLVRSKRISVDKCPQPFDHEPLIYELTDFTVPQEEEAGC
ncbi:hypothetical protein DYD21_14000 [Rhodohalobacter sp. SW132]|uniref:hypothetical protein n=1 Tax=Rhodohalobacter sp. SW132 TaxID=2293433 RepID=UPI000E276A8A|nr:hypothetical protein [Rhodohalobacter sp. SW132]REL32926.1 hypothetical protein DYD21_14000 [Rhodohalobacter sp. SW132]